MKALFYICTVVFIVINLSLPTFGQIKIVDNEGPKTIEPVTIQGEITEYDSTNLNPQHPKRYIGQTFLLYRYYSKHFFDFKSADLFIPNIFPDKNTYFKVVGISDKPSTYPNAVVFEIENTVTGELLLYDATQNCWEEVILVAYFEYIKRRLKESGQIWIAPGKDGLWKVKDLILKETELWIEIQNEKGDVAGYPYFGSEANNLHSYLQKIEKYKIGEWIISGKGEYGRYKGIVVLKGIPYAQFMSGSRIFTFDLTLNYPLGDVPPIRAGYLPYFDKKEAEKVIAKYGRANFISVLNNEVKLGMTKELVELSVGFPDRLNTTVTTRGDSEQWVYDEYYVYFRNGKVTAWQNR